jgi:uncharacterized protein involved in oxidation of intracellular sulfur
MKTLFVLNDGPYGTEKPYNAFRLVNSLSKLQGEEVRVFLMGDAVGCGVRGQKTPDGYYNVERMIMVAARQGVPVHACGTCLDARGLADPQLADNVSRSTLAELTTWTTWADKVIVF